MKFTLTLLLFVLLSACSSNEKATTGKIVFIESHTVFEAFQMKKDYDVQMEKELKSEAERLDSLALSIREHAGDSMELFRQQKQYYVIKNAYDAKFEQLSGKYTNEVNARLNELIKSFAEVNGYRMVLASRGEGNVMYVHDDDNVTKQIITYINKKYGK